MFIQTCPLMLGGVMKVTDNSSTANSGADVSSSGVDVKCVLESF